MVAALTLAAILVFTGCAFLLGEMITNFLNELFGHKQKEDNYMEDKHMVRKEQCMIRVRLDPVSVVNLQEKLKDGWLVVSAVKMAQPGGAAVDYILERERPVTVTGFGDVGVSTTKYMQGEKARTREDE